MPFLMIRNDITKVAADAIVNPANRNLLQGSGTSRAIYQAAGEQELTASCEAIGRCDLGRAVCTPAFGLSAKYIFHAVCPAWHGGGFGEAEQLASAYHSALKLAAKYHCESVAFPLLSSGNYGYPKEQAFRIAVDTITMKPSTCSRARAMPFRMAPSGTGSCGTVWNTKSITSIRSIRCCLNTIRNSWVRDLSPAR